MGEDHFQTTVSEHDWREDKLQASEQRYVHILENVFDGIISINNAQRITTFNHGAQRIFGYSAAEVLGKHIDILLPVYIRDIHGGYVDKFASARETSRAMADRGEIRGLRKDGSEFPAEASIANSMVGGERTLTVILRDITERKNAEDDLRESEARYRTLVEFSPDAILVQIEGRIVFANPAGAALYGAASPEDLEGVAILDLIHPAEREAHVRRRALIESNTKPLEITEQRRLRLDGKDILVESRGIPFTWRGQVAILGVSQDISDRKRRETALHEGEAQYRRLVEISPTAIWIICEDRIVFANSSMAKLVGAANPDELIGIEALNFVPPDFKELIQQQRRMIIDENVPVTWMERKMVRLDGVNVEVESHGTRIDWKTRPSVLTVFRDLTSRKLAEAAAQEKEVRLRDLERRLSDLSRFSVVEELSSVLAHELNQPLAAIVNYLEVGREAIKTAGASKSGSKSGRAVEMMDKALLQANRATEIVCNLRDIRLQDATTRDEEDINDVVTEVSAVGLIDVQKEAIKTHMNLGSSLPKVLINKIQIQQVVSNLLRNGVEAMADCDTRRLSIVTSLGKEGFIELSVTDTGSGLSDDIRDRLFEPFVSTKPNGMGLGLAICYSIIEAHGGELSAAPNPDGGTIFQITLPFAASAREAHDK